MYKKNLDMDQLGKLMEALKYKPTTLEEYDKFVNHFKTLEKNCGIGNVSGNDILEDLTFVNQKVVEISELANGLVETYSKKNQDYGDSFDISLDEDGLLAAKIRMGDKFRRFAHLIDNEASVSDESIDDTLLDLAGYALMTVRWRRENA